MHEENTSKWGIGNDGICLYMKLEELLKESLGLKLEPVKNNQCLSIVHYVENERMQPKQWQVNFLKYTKSIGSIFHSKTKRV